MTQISFDGTYGYGPPPPLPVHLTDRGCLHWISHRGACTVSFDKIYILRMQPAHGEHITHQLSLGRGAGNGQSGLTRAIGVNASGQDNCMDGVAVLASLRQGLEQQDSPSLGTHITVGRGIKRAAHPLDRKHRGMAKSYKRIRMHEQVHTADQGHWDLPIPQCLASMMQGNQRRRAGRIYGYGWSVQIKKVGKSIGSNAKCIARHGISGHARQVFQSMLPIIQPGNADVHTATAPSQSCWLYPGIFHGFMGHFQQQPLLWIEPSPFARRYAEKGRVKFVYVGEDARSKSDTAPRLGTVDMLQLVNGPTILGNE